MIFENVEVRGGWGREGEECQLLCDRDPLCGSHRASFYDFFLQFLFVRVKRLNNSSSDDLSLESYICPCKRLTKFLRRQVLPQGPKHSLCTRARFL